MSDEDFKMELINLGHYLKYNVHMLAASNITSALIASGKFSDYNEVCEMTFSIMEKLRDLDHKSIVKE